ncbi:oxygen-dependent protoporphyrinogen oxidase [Pontibacter ummariensis]|uniref:Coproporphyrinogen III oxidase n=1 Tax=Pontibacter ummariensis TaxID=1610492 RepID=A0A239F0J6_9BACT|nr:protoporphyrinogen oxidase [Pontibacter ummariensis]PRY12654.1 oxygen-dependent protoporphyrinogen oxidase [Pontibacter ummariensis]SNS50355.1 oxygen-dependent protoporphyrinogen oxidase [Pontibacter ummariensis]
MRVAIIGAGISGLALAYYLQKLGIAYDLFEASPRVGGNIQTVRVQDYLLELGPNFLQPSPELDDLIKELKLGPQVMQASHAHEDKYVLRDGDYHKLPDTPFSLLANNFFSWKTKFRILKERDVPPADIAYETVSQFFERRFGKGVIDYGVSPYMTGLFAGDPEKLLVKKALPKLKELELKHGSVLKGLARHPGSVSRAKAFSFVNGMSTLPKAIAGKLVSLHTEHRVEMITRNQGKYVVSCTSSGDYDTEEYDLLVLALPAHQAADLLHFTFPGMAAALQNIQYPPLAVVHSVYYKKEVAHPLHGLGAMHPQVEHPFACGAVWSSSIFEGRCRPHEVLFTSFIGGSQCAQHALTAPPLLQEQVHKELKALHMISADKPIFQYVHLWEHSLPQYDLYIEDAHEIAKSLEQEGLFVAANWHSGVSVPTCIHYAKELAYKIILKRPQVLNS